ncbi:uncharacterized protein [Dysidea avara]|uniref:uncharacterized protein isoform X2 n=1 Tax=Dysidea avara TaxID=196820 RepID=UPI00332A71DE
MAEGSWRQTREVGEKAAINLDNKTTVLVQWESSNNVKDKTETSRLLWTTPVVYNEMYLQIIREDLNFKTAVDNTSSLYNETLLQIIRKD